VGAGANDFIADAAGAPVDLVAGAINLGIRGINAATGANIPQAIAPIGDAVAAELSRYKALSDRQARPGRSTTAQDTIKALQRAREGAHHLSLFNEMMLAVGPAYEAGRVRAATAAATAAIAKNRLIAMRSAGMADVRDLVRGMLLNPQLAKTALEVVGPEKVNSHNIRFTQQLNRVAAIAAQRMIGPAPKQPVATAQY
jgi:hypothetical protein